MGQQVLKDINWWRIYLPEYNSTSIMWLAQELQADALIATDSCLKGIGGYSEGRFFHAEVPQFIQSDDRYSIVHLELIALVIGVRLWGNKVRGVRYAVNCDNEAVVHVVNKGASKDPILLDWLRELAFECAVMDCQVEARFILGRTNRIPDILSRWTINKSYRQQFQEIRQPHWQEEEVTDEWFKQMHNW